MFAVRNILVLLLFSVVLVNSRYIKPRYMTSHGSGTRTNVSIIYSSYSKACVKFIHEQLVPAFRKLPQHLILKLNPNGKPQKLGNWDSDNGNMVQQCIMQQEGGAAQHLRFIDCYLTAGSPQKYQTCAHKTGFDTFQLTYCVQQTKKVPATDVGFLPQITFNGIYDPDLENQAIHNFFAVVCELSKYPLQCAERRTENKLDKCDTQEGHNDNTPDNPNEEKVGVTTRKRIKPHIPKEGVQDNNWMSDDDEGEDLKKQENGKLPKEEKKEDWKVKEVTVVDNHKQKVKEGKGVSQSETESAVKSEKQNIQNGHKDSTPDKSNEEKVGVTTSKRIKHHIPKEGVHHGIWMSDDDEGEAVEKQEDRKIPKEDWKVKEVTVADDHKQKVKEDEGMSESKTESAVKSEQEDIKNGHKDSSPDKPNEEKVAVTTSKRIKPHKPKEGVEDGISMSDYDEGEDDEKQEDGEMPKEDEEEKEEDWVIEEVTIADDHKQNEKEGKGVSESETEPAVKSENEENQQVKSEVERVTEAVKDESEVVKTEETEDKKDESEIDKLVEKEEKELIEEVKEKKIGCTTEEEKGKENKPGNFSIKEEKTDENETNKPNEEDENETVSPEKAEKTDVLETNIFSEGAGETDKPADEETKEAESKTDIPVQEEAKLGETNIPEEDEKSGEGETGKPVEEETKEAEDKTDKSEDKETTVAKDETDKSREENNSDESKTENPAEKEAKRDIRKENENETDNPDEEETHKPETEVDWTDVLRKFAKGN